MAAVRLGVRLNGRLPNIRITRAIGVTTAKNSRTSIMGLVAFAIVAPILSQSLLSADKRAGPTIPEQQEYDASRKDQARERDGLLPP